MKKQTEAKKLALRATVACRLDSVVGGSRSEPQPWLPVLFPISGQPQPW
jgi:hypothetical protein